MLMEKVKFFQSKFIYCRLFFVVRNDVKYVFKLVRDVVVFQMFRFVGINYVKIFKEICVICLEEIDQEKMFIIDGCLYKYCFFCMK